MFWVLLLNASSVTLSFTMRCAYGDARHVSLDMVFAFIMVSFVLFSSNITLYDSILIWMKLFTDMYKVFSRYCLQSCNPSHPMSVIVLQLVLVKSFRGLDRVSEWYS